MKGEVIELPPGFRFHPTDEELVNAYLCKKCAAQTISASVIADVDLYKYDPWQLPELALCGEKEWYFFTPRDRKYPKGSRPNRAAGNGYWKATGADKPIGTHGIKKALVFYAGKAPNGIKTNWIMHEYRLANVDRSASTNQNSRLDDWVLCRLYNKKGKIEICHPDNRKPLVSFEDRKVPSFVHTDNTSESSEGSWNKEAESEPKKKEMEMAFDDLAFDQYMNGIVMEKDDQFGNQVEYHMDQFSHLQDMYMFLHTPF